MMSTSLLRMYSFMFERYLALSLQLVLCFILASFVNLSYSCLINSYELLTIWLQVLNPIQFVPGIYYTFILLMSCVPSQSEKLKLIVPLIYCFGSSSMKLNYLFFIQMVFQNFLSSYKKDLFLEMQSSNYFFASYFKVSIESISTIFSFSPTLNLLNVGFRAYFGSLLLLMPLIKSGRSMLFSLFTT